VGRTAGGRCFGRRDRSRTDAVPCRPESSTLTETFCYDSYLPNSRCDDDRSSWSCAPRPGAVLAMVPAASRPTDVEKFRTCDAPRMNRDVRFTLRSGHAPTPLLQERAISRSDPERVSGRHDRPVPCSALQHPTGSSALGGGSERTNGIRARCARAGHPDRPPREQTARPTGVGVGRPLPCPAASNASRGAERARVRPQQLPEACSRRARARSVFVGALVSGMEDASHRGFGPASRRASHDVAGAGGMAERRAPPDRRIAHGPRAGQAPIGSSLRLMSTARAECVSSPIAT